MFSATLSDIKLLKDSVDTISGLIDEGIFRFKPDGIELTAADRAMVTLVDFKLSPGAFESYQCDKPAHAGLNLLNFLTILRRAGPEDKLFLKMEDSGNRLEVTLTGESTRKFAIPLLELNADETPNVSGFEYSAGAEVSTEVFSAGVEDAGIVADSVIIELNPDSLKMSAEGDGSRAELKLDKGGVALSTVTAAQPVKARYPLEYLKKMLKAGKLSAKAGLKMSNDYPMRLDFSSDKVRLGFVLAPRVSEE